MLTAVVAAAARLRFGRWRHLTVQAVALTSCAALAACASPDALAGKRKAAKVSPATAAATTEAPDTVVYGGRDDVRRYAADVAARHGLATADVQALLAQARYVPAVARYIMPAAAGTAKNWDAYRRRFVEPTRVAAGVAFWHENASWLALAEERYGVPAAIIVGIIGVETLYGRQMGNFRQIDALATLAFDFPTGRSNRSGFFRAELEAWLVANTRPPGVGTDPVMLKSSYAGAVGLPQFMPTSVNRWGVDFDGDGRIDLHDSPADAIGSVANYLAGFGWQRGLTTTVDVTVPDDLAGLARLLAPDIVPSFTAADFTDAGARLADNRLPADARLALIRLENGDAPPSYVAGTQNFYAITRYNWSSYYAMAVITLGEAVTAAR